MKRIFPMPGIFPMLIAALLAGTGAACLAQESPLFDLTISLPHTGNELPVIHWAKKGDTTEPHFHVVLRNISGETQRVYRYTDPGFEVTDAAGRTWSASRQPGGWIGSSDRDGGMRSLQPGECLVFDVWFARGSSARDSLCYHFQPAQPGGKVTYPTGKVTLWPIFAENLVDKILKTELTGTPVKCIFE